MKNINSTQNIAIFGTGGFAREVLCVIIDCWKILNIKHEGKVCFVEHDSYWKEEEIMRIPVIKQSDFNPSTHLAIIGTGDPTVRKKIAESLPENTRFASFIHPNVVISEWVELGEGTVVCSGSILTCNIKIGKHAHLNLHTTIGHDCQIGDYFTTAPGVNVSGICQFGDGVYFGTNAAVKQGIKICSDVTIGMGGIVVKDINEPGVYVGNPVKKMEK